MYKRYARGFITCAALEWQLERHPQCLSENKDSVTLLGTAALPSQQAGLDVDPAHLLGRARVAQAPSKSTHADCVGVSTCLCTGVLSGSSASLQREYSAA